MASPGSGQPPQTPAAAGDRAPIAAGLSGPSGRRVRVLTYNIECGKKLAGVLDVLQSNPADVILLQEVPIRSPRRSPPDHGAWLADRLGMRYAAEPGWADHLPPGIIGLGLLVNGRILSRGCLPRAPERRFALTAEVEAAGLCFAVCSAHLRSPVRPLLAGFPATMPVRMRQARHIVNWARSQRLPVVVGGDFNTLAWTPEYHVMRRALRDCAREAGRPRPTRTTWGVPMRIDYFFVSSHWRIIDCRTIRADASDHSPLAMELEPNEPGGDLRVGIVSCRP